MAGPGGANISLNYEGIARRASKFNRERTEITGKLRSLMRDVDAMMQSDFVTEKAGPKFHRDYQEWDRSAKKTIEALEGMSKFLNKGVIERFQSVDR